MADTPLIVPPDVIEALKRGDKAAAMKMLLQGGKVSSLKDVMRILEQLQASGALKGTDTRQSARPMSTGAASHAPARSAPNLPPHTTPHTPSPVTPPAQLSGLSPGEVPRRGGSAMGFVVLLIVGALVAWSILHT